MSADRYEITDAEYYPYINGVSALSATGTAVIGAIRQQARDIEQLRSELAAAVAERDMLSELAQRRERQLSVALNEVEQLRAYKQAVDSAPVVARPKFIRGEICGCQTRPTHYVGEMDCPWHKIGDGQPKEAKD